MAIEFYIEDILKSPESTFMKIVSQIISKNDKRAEIELVRQYTEVDKILFEAIKSILDDLKKEEGVVSRFLYRYFNIEIFKNKKREQLIILGSQLKTKYNNLEEEIKRVQEHIHDISSSLYNLKLLRSALDKKRALTKERKMINKSNALIKKLDRKIENIREYEISLKHKEHTLRDNLKMYDSLYKEIPQNKKLQEDYYLEQLSYKRV